MKNRVCFVIPYFGEMPNFFELFLKSCEINKDFNWLIITDDNSKYNYPKNVRKIEMTFKECQLFIKSKFDFDVSIEFPKKLCDYKPAYGYIFSEYLKTYDFWGYCDLDVIFGNLGHFITDQIIDSYDRLFPLGHLSLYRNNDRMTKIFMESINNKSAYKEVYTNSNMCSFDEWTDYSINSILLDNNIKIYCKEIIADIDPYNSSFVLSHFDMLTKRWFKDEVKNSLFKWDNGKIIRIWFEDKKIKSKEYLYIHLQKRNMKNLVSDLKCECFYIVPNRFIVLDKSRESFNLKKYKFKYILDYKQLRKRRMIFIENTKLYVKNKLDLK